MLASLACLGAGGPAETVLEAQPEGLRRALASEGLAVLDDTGGGRESFITAYVVFRQPRDVVIDLMRQAERQHEYRPELSGVKTIARTADGRIDEQSIRIVFTKLVYRLRYREQLEADRFEWALDEGFDNDIAHMAGFWEFHPFAKDPARTLGRFGSSIDVGPAVPQMLQDRMSRRTVFRYLRNCRQWIDARGEWQQ